MDRGVTGFRYDATKHLYEDTLFRDEPYLDAKDRWKSNDGLDHIYTHDLPENIAIVKEWRRFMDNYNMQNKKKFSPYVISVYFYVIYIIIYHIILC